MVVRYQCISLLVTLQICALVNVNPSSVCDMLYIQTRVYQPSVYALLSD
jgi:hypothetical protein